MLIIDARMSSWRPVASFVVVIIPANGRACVMLARALARAGRLSSRGERENVGQQPSYRPEKCLSTCLRGGPLFARPGENIERA